MKYLDGSFSVGGASEAFDEGYERTFGKRRERHQGKRYVYREVSPGQVEALEVGADYAGETRGGGHKSEEEVFGHLHAQDGADISTRKRHREYMKSGGLTLADDYRETWAKAEAKRAAGPDSKGIREALNKAMYQLTEGRRGK